MGLGQNRLSQSIRMDLDMIAERPMKTIKNGGIFEHNWGFSLM